MTCKNLKQHGDQQRYNSVYTQLMKLFSDQQRGFKMLQCSQQDVTFHSEPKDIMLITQISDK